MPLHVLTIEADEVDRIQHQRREPAVTHGRGDDLTGEREQQARAFDEQQRQQMLLRETDKTENASIDEFRVEQDFLAFTGFGRQRQNYIKVVLRNWIGIDVDIDVDVEGDSSEMGKNLGFALSRSLQLSSSQFHLCGWIYF